MTVAGVEGVGNGCLGFVGGAVGVSWWGSVGGGGSGGCLHLPDLEGLVWEGSVSGPNSTHPEAQLGDVVAAAQLECGVDGEGRHSSQHLSSILCRNCSSQSADVELRKVVMVTDKRRGFVFRVFPYLSWYRMLRHTCEVGVCHPPLGITSFRRGNVIFWHINDPFHFRPSSISISISTLLSHVWFVEQR